MNEIRAGGQHGEFWQDAFDRSRDHTSVISTERGTKGKRSAGPDDARVPTPAHCFQHARAGRGLQTGPVTRENHCPLGHGSSPAT
ncbi:MAG TPA: hypothetical protein VKJ45_26430 [Blastocatellia bacterium]|nr:hypothetical protein [Blastocatellia bacterium]